jgi:hypothetical protein
VADKLTKQSENAPGQWYVDTSCALYRLCLEEAPNLLTYNSDETAVHFVSSPKHPRKQLPRSARWMFALRSR